MLYGMYTSAAGAFMQTKQVDTVSNNIVNVNTPGYRGDFTILMERPAEVDEIEADGLENEFIYRNPILDKLGGGPHILRSFFDEKPGSIQHTDRKLDVAVEGPGFIEIQREGDDRRFFTRAGNFFVDDEGVLKTADGKGTVLSTDGQPIQILNSTTAQIDAYGNVIFQGDDGDAREAGRISVVDFDDYPSLRKHGDTLFYHAAGQAGTQVDGKVRQGYLESSSSDSVVEMTNLISAMRAYESNLQALKMQDSTLERLIGTVGRVGR